MLCMTCDKSTTSDTNCAKIIKGLNALEHLINNIRHNYLILESIYNKREKIDDAEYKPVEFAFNNFILIASILKQHIKSFEKNLDTYFKNSKKYQKVYEFLFTNEWHLILLGMRNYLQHVFHIHLCFGSDGDTDNEDLYISGHTLLMCNELHPNKPENKSLLTYFKYFIALSIMPFADENMCLIEMFYKKYTNIIYEHYKSKLKHYSKEKDRDQYAEDLSDIYLDNMDFLIDSNIDN